MAIAQMLTSKSIAKVKDEKISRTINHIYDGAGKKQSINKY